MKLGLHQMICNLTHKLLHYVFKIYDCTLLKDHASWFCIRQLALLHRLLSYAVQICD